MNGKGTFLALVVVFSAGFLTACNPPASDQHLQEQAAQATEQAKQGSKEALADARVAAANAERAVNDVAAGVKQGIDGKGTPGSSGARVDLNDASETDIAALPGISAGKARQIIHHRPYASTHDLVKNGLLTQGQFDQIAPQVTVH
jgi:DNA uptake protein ComE-like DNA-binding protein